MDVLSNVLETVRLTGALMITADLNDPWPILSPSFEVLLQSRSSKAECVSFFHIITAGKCLFKMESGKPFLLGNGSVIIFPHGCPHIMASTLQIQPTPIVALPNGEGMQGLPKVKHAGPGENTKLICGYLLCDQRFNPLLGAVPEVIILSPEKERISKDNPELLPNTLSITPNGWLDMNLRHLTDEIKEKNEGSATLITRLIELMYMEVLRRYMKNLPENSRGWLAAVRDHEVGKALMYLHSNPEEKWNVETLASKVGVSRSAFAKRFTELIGESPMLYLTHWRMQLAKNLLQQPDLSMAMVAERIGYDSNVSFIRAFKRYVGETPGNWRNYADTINGGIKQVL